MNEVFPADLRTREIDLARCPDFDLGAVRVSPSRRRMIGAPVGELELEPRVMKVLVALHSAGGKVLSRDDLIDACWGGRIVGDDALNRCIVALRRLLRDVDPPPFEIETIPRVGYRLAVPESGAEPASRRPVRRRLRPWAAWGALAMTLAVAAGLVAVRTPPRDPAAAADPTAGTPQRREAERLHASAVRLIHQRTRPGYAEAETLLRRAVAIDPTHAPSWAQLGIAISMPAWWNAQGHPGAFEGLRAEAIGDIRRALAIDPRLSEAHAAMGLALSGTGGARRWLERAVALDSGNAEAWMWLGNDLARHNELRRALDAYRRAATLDPAWQPAVGNHVELLGRLGRRREALAEIDLYARRTENAGGARLIRSRLLAAEGRLTEAAMEAAAMLAARSPDPWRGQLLLLQVSDYAGDAATHRRVLAGAPQLAGLIAAYRDRDNALRLARQRSDDWWDDPSPGARARHLLAAGEGRLLIALYDRRYGDPGRFWDNCLCPNFGVAPPLALALRDVGRGREARILRDRLTATVARLEEEGDRSIILPVLASQLAAIDGDAAAAGLWLSRAVARGWRGQIPDLGFDPGRDPVFRDVVRNPGFQRAVAGYRTALAAEALRFRNANIAALLAR